MDIRNNNNNLKNALMVYCVHYSLPENSSNLSDAYDEFASKFRTIVRNHNNFSARIMEVLSDELHSMWHYNACCDVENERANHVASFIRVVKDLYSEL